MLARLISPASSKPSHSPRIISHHNRSLQLRSAGWNNVGSRSYVNRDFDYELYDMRNGLIPPPKHDVLPPVFTFTRKEVARHNKITDCWIIISGNVFNVTNWLKDHPGGTAIMQAAGQDATDLFSQQSHSFVAFDEMRRFYVGDVVDEEKYERRTDLDTPPIEDY
eukprot:TRINITY_DN406_c0_g1_i1.p1 TRINITY_DN406_c0_g1~~TRINITY_DN406_c0_g1_i1.p1  ORF type:complete len:165 (-),score=25.41 TRINITY_DN406_c0_g1_i1:39-533(-)